MASHSPRQVKRLKKIVFVPKNQAKSVSCRIIKYVTNHLFIFKDLVSNFFCCIYKKKFKEKKTLVWVIPVFWHSSGIVTVWNQQTDRQIDRQHDFRNQMPQGHFQTFWCMTKMNDSSRGTEVKRSGMTFPQNISCWN